MRYQPPLNSTPTPEVPEPSYFDGNKQAGIYGAIPPGASIEQPMREILAVIQAAGLTPSNADLTQLLQAIQIIAAGAGGAPNSFAYNPVYPEVTVNNGVMSITPSTGQVVLATGQTWIHRGGTLYNSSDLLLAARTLATVANKTYHMRWRYNGGAPTLALYDLADVAYNPGAVAENDAQFDTTYDDMLIAKVVTNGANLPTVTALRNKAKLADVLNASTSAGIVEAGGGAWSYSKLFAVTLNWARRPSRLTPTANVRAATVVGTGLQGGANLVDVPVYDRYGVSFTVISDFDQAQTNLIAAYLLNVGA